MSSRILVSILLALAPLSGRATAPSPATETAAAPSALALKILDLTDAQAGLKAEFDSSVDALIQQLTSNGFPSAGVVEIRAAMTSWFNTSIRWEELKPQLAALYDRHFTAGELAELAVFFETPLGRKTARALPALSLEFAALRQEYAATKQAALDERIQKIVRQYRR